MYYKFEIITGDEFTHEEYEEFWQQNVNMDDWDYMLLFEDPESKLLDHHINNDTWNGEPEVDYYPREYDLSRLLTGCCSNTWYPKIRFRGKVYTVGVAYHA